MGREAELEVAHVDLRVTEADRLEPCAELIGRERHEHVVVMAGADDVEVDGIGAEEDPTGSQHAAHLGEDAVLRFGRWDVMQHPEAGGRGEPLTGQTSVRGVAVHDIDVRVRHSRRECRIQIVVELDRRDVRCTLPEEVGRQPRAGTDFDDVVAEVEFNQPGQYFGVEPVRPIGAGQELQMMLVHRAQVSRPESTGAGRTATGTFTPAMPSIRAAIRRIFGSLDTYNYRLFFTGELISHTGSWMQNMAEAWLVLTLTHSGAAVGATFAFRFLPVLLFGLWGGAIVDRYDRRTVLLVTQSLEAVLAIALWLIVLTDVVQVWMVFALAVALGFITVVDQPAHHTFVEEMVGRDRLSNAVALNSAVGNSARITGPAIAGLLIASVGEAWVFFVNAVSFVAVVGALAAMRRSELRPFHTPTTRPRVREGLAYAWSITEIRATILLVGVVGTLVYNFPTFLTLMASDTFHGGAGLAGFLMAVLGIGTVIGALSAAHRSRQSSRTVLAGAAALGLSLVVAATLPGEAMVAIALVPVGALAVFFGSTANAHMQMWSAPDFRGRVMGIYSFLTLGTTVVGGPFVGWVCQHWNPRAGLGLAGTVTAVSAVALAVPLRRDADVEIDVDLQPAEAAIDLV